MPGPIVKGTALSIIVGDNRIYNPETGNYLREVEYRGIQSAIFGLQAQFINAGLAFRTANDGPIYSMFVSTPEQVIDENLDRWEIFTESTEKSIFELPDVVTLAESYDATVQAGKQTFRQICENAVTSKQTTLINDLQSIVIRHLRAGVTGWQLDLVGLRRTRRILASAANSETYRITLDTGLFVYSTAQLNLPALVAFGIPATPSDISDLFQWGWRKRSQRVEIIGSFVEQTVELLFAPWSVPLSYLRASTNLAW